MIEFVINICIIGRKSIFFGGAAAWTLTHVLVLSSETLTHVLEVVGR